MRLSLRTVVMIGVVVGLGLPMGVATWTSYSKQKAALDEQAKAQHKRATAVLALGVQKSLWDISPESATPLVKSIMDDHQIVSSRVLDAKGEVFVEESDESRRLGTILTLEEMVKNEDETIGKVIVEFSLETASQELKSRLTEILVTAGIQAVVCLILLSLLINLRVIRRVAKIKDQAGMLAQKSLETPFIWKASDEVGELGNSLESTRVALRGLFADIEAKGKELAHMNANLENIVEEKTATIKMILNHVQSGFFLVDKDLNILDGYTKSCEKLLANSKLTGRKITKVLGLNKRQFEHFQVCMDQVFEDIFPEEVSLSQAPSRFTLPHGVMHLSGSTIRSEKGEIEKILFTLVDITELERIEKENKENKALIQILQNISSFRDFMEDTRSRLDQSGNLATNSKGSDSQTELRRELHTMKGNAAAFGLDRVAETIHHIEDNSSISEEMIDSVKREFNDFLRRHSALLSEKGNASSPSASLPLETIVKYKNRFAKHKATPELLKVVDDLFFEIQSVPVDTMLRPLVSYVGKLSERLGKQVNITLRGEDTKVDPARFKPVFHNLVHILRNAIDHGIESPSDRGSKSLEGNLVIDVSQNESNLTITVKDDGRGLSAEKICSKAIEKKLVTPQEIAKLSFDQRLELIFLDGLSTADQVTDTSGRGVGLSAVKESVVAAGGVLNISTTENKGTSFKLSFALQADMSVQKKLAA